MGHKPLKKFGQNYLTDKNIVNKLIAQLDYNTNDIIIEIGPGKGFITEELVKHSDNIICIEIDTRVIEDLKLKFPGITVLNDDFMKISIEELSNGNSLQIVGNIPFNQTGNVLFTLIDNINVLTSATLIVPFDIAKRVVAKKRTKEYGILTVLFNYFAEPMLVSKISRNVFFPKPNLDAAILHLRFNQILVEDIDNQLFVKVVKSSFGNRRKTLYNSLRNSIFKEYDFSHLDLDLSKRAEELDVDDYLKLTRYIQNNNA